MDTDIPHIFVTSLLVFVIVLGIEHLDFMREASRTKRALVTGVAVTVAVFILNLFWSYSLA